MVSNKNRSKKGIRVQLVPKASAPTRKKKAQEITAIGKILRSIGGIGGGALGTMIGQGTAGSQVGNGLGAAISRWFGQGDYTVGSNTIVQKAAASGTIPNMHKDGQSIIVRHKEFLTEITGATSFTVRNEFFLNPGLSNSFPWLATIAAQYSEYRIRGMVFHYVPTSGDAVSSTNGAVGCVMLQTSYRSTEAAPVSKIEMLNEYWSSEGKPSESFCHPIECDPKENPFNVQYIRTGALPSTENQLMYDLGRTTVAVSGQQANGTVLGDLWCTYEIELKKPIIAGTNNNNIQSYAGFSLNAVGSGNPFGTSGTMNTSFSNFQTAPVFTPNTIEFQFGTVGVYQVSCFYQGCTSFNANAWTVSGGTLITAVNSSSSAASQYTVGTGQATNSTWVRINDPAVKCTLTSNLATANACTAVRVLITEINPSAIT